MSDKSKEIPEPRGSHFAAFDELVVSEPYIIKVSPEEYAKIEELLANPPKPNARLRALFKGKNNE